MAFKKMTGHERRFMPGLMHQPSVLFVCLGNICRSPLAEAAFRQEAQRAGLAVTVDSAGTGNWHVGSAPDPRAIAQASGSGVDISAYRARQVNRADFTRFTHIYALDANNLADLRKLRPSDATAHLGLLLDEVPGLQGQSVADPYYGGPEDFAQTWGEVTRAARALVARLQAEG
jgi:protein-tyrosine phosphatase